MRSRTLWVIGAELLATSALVVGALVTPLAGPGSGRLARGGAVTNAWVFRPTNASGVLESRCIFDLTQGPVRVTAEPWGGPMSVSVRSTDGRVLAAEDERSASQGVDIVLALKGQAAPRGVKLVIAPAPRGVVLDRRLAPSPERVAAADRGRRGNQCAPAGMDFPAAR